MKSSRQYVVLLLAFSALGVASCNSNNPVSSATQSSGSGSSTTVSSSSNAKSSSGAASSGEASSASSSVSSKVSSSPAVSGHTPEEVAAYMNGLKSTSVSNHLYYHYLRYTNSASSYADWDVWAWPLYPKAGEGYRFDWKGRTTSIDRLSATGEAVYDDFGGACAEIDLTKKNYDGGWNATKKTMGGTAMDFYQKDGVTLDKKIGLQTVKSVTRTSGNGFWVNDGDNLSVALDDYALSNADGTTSYHVFAIQEHVSSASATPVVDYSDPYANDDGTNVTYGLSQYNNVTWTDKAKQATSPLFLNGDTSKSYLTKGAGVGYQIMVSSFADSDGDGFGDIYGIDQKLDYLKDLGVNVLWLTPIQLSDSYHGYDISDYEQVDPKFGSTKSPNTPSNGVITPASAMEDYLQLIQDAHSKGMAVIMDLVLNHTSTSNKWFHKSAELNADYRGYYQWGNHKTDSTAISEDHYWYPYGEHVYSYYAKFGSAMPELNYSYQATRDAVAAVAKDWCSKGVDGFRMDAVKHIFLNDEVSASATDTLISDISAAGDYSSNLTKNLNFWKELSYDVKSVYPNAFFVGENFDGSAYHVAPFYEGFDSLFDFYSYFNLTSAAAHARNSSISKVTVTSYDGNATGASSFLPSKDGDATNPSTSIKYGDKWNLPGVLNANNLYRTGSNASTSYGFINGAFTSNHDIARCLNRVAGTESNDLGLTAQGEISDTNYDDYLKSATCVELAELMLPGCTWIYYGDELGMSGNFQNGATKGTDDYADLSYRQPMKWKQDGQVNDGSFTTGFAITGSGASIKWDDINASSKVVDVANASSNEHFRAIRQFANLKGETPALIKGSYAAYNWQVNGADADYVFNIGRSYGGETYNIIINFSPYTTLGAGLTGTVVASYNGAVATSLPPLSAIVVKA